MGGYGGGKGEGPSKRDLDELAALEAGRTRLGPEPGNEVKFSPEKEQRMRELLKITKTTEDPGAHRDAWFELEELGRERDNIEMANLQKLLVVLGRMRPRGELEKDPIFLKATERIKLLERRRQLQRNRPEL